MVLTHYYGHIPAMVHNAIDWLTRRWNHSALHDKPLAVIGPTEDGYSGVWSRHKTEESPTHPVGRRHRTHHRNNAARGRHKTR